jgi:hypothetical protein
MPSSSELLLLSSFSLLDDEEHPRNTLETLQNVRESRNMCK